MNVEFYGYMPQQFEPMEIEYTDVSVKKRSADDRLLERSKLRQQRDGLDKAIKKIKKTVRFADEMEQVVPMEIDKDIKQVKKTARLADDQPIAMEIDDDAVVVSHDLFTTMANIQLHPQRHWSI